MNESARHRLSLVLLAVALLLIVSAWYYAFLAAPTERTMGTIQRIFYLHLPAAFLSFLAFFVVFVGSVAYLTTRRIGWDWAAASAAEGGGGFCAAVLITGPPWAKPVRGLWGARAAGGGRSLLRRRAHHRAALGQARLGHLVDLGRAADHHAHPLHDLRRLPDAAALRHRRGAARAAGGGGGDPRLRGRAHRLHGEPLVAHPAPRAGHRRRRRLGARPADVVGRAVGVRRPVDFCELAVLPTLPDGGDARRADPARPPPTPLGENMEIGLKHLFYAFAIVWALLLGYVFSLARRQKQLADELENLKKSSARRSD